MFHHPDQGRTIKVPQPLPAAVGRGKRGHLVYILRGAFHLYIKVGLDLEQLAEVFVIVVEQVVEVGAADHDHIQIERDRLGAQGGHSDQAVVLGHVLNADLPGFQDPL